MADITAGIMNIEKTDNENKYYAAEYKLKYLDRLGGCQLIFYKSQVKKIELVS